MLQVSMARCNQAAKPISNNTCGAIENTSKRCNKRSRLAVVCAITT